MLAHFQAQYPLGSIITELVLVHEGTYIVRATAQVGDRPLATGMAGAATVEAAEDQARSRVLTWLSQSSLVPPPNTTTLSAGRATTPPLAPPSLHPPSGLPTPPIIAIANGVPLPGTTPTGPDAPAIAPPVIAPDPTPAVPTAPVEPTESGAMADPTADWSTEWPAEHDPPADVEAALSGLSPAWSEPETDQNWAQHNLSTPSTDADGLPLVPSPLPPDLVPAAALPPKAPKGGAKAIPKAKPTPVAVPSSEQEPVIDRSDEIAQIDVEMRRLGWGREEGREHLAATYGKRSRQHLSDAELLEFLSFLQAQPSPTTSPF